MARKTKTLTVYGVQPAFSPAQWQCNNLSEDMFEFGGTTWEQGVSDEHSGYAADASEAIELLLHSGWTTSELEELSLGDILLIARGSMQ